MNNLDTDTDKLNKLNNDKLNNDKLNNQTFAQKCKNSKSIFMKSTKEFLIKYNQSKDSL